MNEKEYQSKINEMQQQIELLQKTNLDLVSHNLQLSQQINAYYDVRRRIQMLKELVIRHKELIRHADLRDDAELMALIETRLEEELPHENPLRTEGTGRVYRHYTDTSYRPVPPLAYPQDR